MKPRTTINFLEWLVKIKSLHYMNHEAVDRAANNLNQIANERKTKKNYHKPNYSNNDSRAILVTND
jgi:hypothetical protein